MTLEDKTLDVEAYNRQREEFLKKRRKLGKKKHHVVTLLGSGGLAKGIIHNLIADGKMYDSLDISKFYLVSNSLERAEGVAGELQDIGGNVEARDYSHIESLKEESDVIVIATDNYAANKQYLDDPDSITAEIRAAMTNNNIEPIKRIADLFSQGKEYKKTVVIATNQTDRLCGIFQAHSGIEARRVVGLNHTDTIRERHMLERYIREHSKSGSSDLRNFDKMLSFLYTIGSHDINMVPTFSNAEYAGLDADSIPFIADAVNQIKQKVIERGVTQLKATGNIPTEAPAKAGAATVRAILNEQDCVVVSMYIDFTEPLFTEDPFFDWKKQNILGPAYIGLPCFFWDGRAELVPQCGSQENKEQSLQWFWRLSDADKQAFLKAANKIRTIYDGWINDDKDNKKIMQEDISSKSTYCFTRRVDKDAEYPAIDLDTVVFSLDSENPARINMYKPGLSLKPRKQFACDLKKLESIQQVCADNKTLAALVLSSNPRTGKDAYKVIRWSLETGDCREYASTNKPLSSIALQDDDVVCSVHNSRDIAAVYSPDGTVSFRTADEERPMSLIAAGDGAMFGISENKIYQIRENQADLVTDKIKAELSGLKVLSTAQGSLLVASGYKSNKVYFIDPATSEITSQDSKQGLCAIDTDKEGNIYLATIRKDRPFILKYDSIESMMQDPPASHFKGPAEIKNATSLEFDNDYLFVFDVRDRIYLVDREFPDLEHKPLKLEQAWTSDSDNYAWVNKC